MENAAKALVIAGGMLIGMIIAALFAYEFLIMADTANAQKEKQRLDRIREFNTQIEKYETINLSKPSYLTAEEVVKIYNYVMEWNKENQLGIEIRYRGTLSIFNTLETDTSKFMEDCLPKKNNANTKLILTKFIIPANEIEYLADASKDESELGRIIGFTIEAKKIEENIN